VQMVHVLETGRITDSGPSGLDNHDRISALEVSEQGHDYLTVSRNDYGLIFARLKLSRIATELGNSHEIESFTPTKLAATKCAIWSFAKQPWLLLAVLVPICVDSILVHMHACRLATSFTVDAVVLYCDIALRACEYHNVPVSCS